MTASIIAVRLAGVILTVEEGFANLWKAIPTVKVTTPSLTAVTLTVSFLPEDRIRGFRAAFLP